MANELDTTTNAVWIPEIVANRTLGVLMSYMSLGRTVAQDTDVTPVRVGQTISLPKRGAVTARQKSENSSATSEETTGTEVTVTINQHWYTQVTEEDYTAALQQGGSTLPGYMEDSAIVLAEKIESALLAHTSEFDNIDAGGSAGDALDGVIDVRKELVDNKVPKMAPKYGYISPRFAARLLKEEAFVDPKITENARPLFEGAIGRVAGFDLFEGQLTPTSGSPAWDQNFFYHRDALILATRPLRQIGAGLGAQSTVVQSEAGVPLRVTRFYDKDAMGEAMRLDVLYGTAVYDDRVGYVLESQ